MNLRVLAINPGSTSTKIAVYEDARPILSHTAQHSAEDIAACSRSLIDQLPMRKACILDFLSQQGCDLHSLNAVVGRGGKIPPCQAGATVVSPEMVEYLKSRPVLDDHASNLGAVLAWEIAGPRNIPAYIYDGVTVDQMDDIARLSGLPDFHRTSGCHALNIRAVTRKIADKLGKNLEDLRAVVCHIGGGITMAAFRDGRMVDILGDEEGPYSPERAGGIPNRQLTAYAFKGEVDEVGLARRLRGKGGLVAYLGTNNAREVEERIAAGDAFAKLVYEGMAYQIAKGIGSLATVLHGRLDCVILTGAVAHSAMLVGLVKDRIGFLAPVEVFAGENEMEALALGGHRVLTGEERAHAFNPVKKVPLHYDK